MFDDHDGKDCKDKIEHLTQSKMPSSSRRAFDSRASSLSATSDTCEYASDRAIVDPKAIYLLVSNSVLDEIVTCVPLGFALRLPITLRLAQLNHRDIVDKDSPLENAVGKIVQRYGWPELSRM